MGPGRVFRRVAERSEYGWALGAMLLVITMIGWATVQTGLIDLEVNRQTGKALAELEREQAELLSRPELSERMEKVREAGEFSKLIELDGSLGLSAPFPVSLNARVSLALREETVENRDNIDAFFLESLVLTSQGRIDDYKLETKSILHVPGMGPISLVLSGKGDETGLVISALHLVGRQLELAAEGEIQWHNTKAIRLDARLDRFDPSTWLPGWPGEYPLRGQC